MSAYHDLDEAIVKTIAGGTKTFGPILVRVSAIAHRLSPLGDSFRLVDRRLQALRKAGRIAFNRKTGWRVEESKP